ncbi:LON peptidase N-terminal domain and RING finger protein 3, partial [Blyttiomyces sp. JEL0837]
LLEDPVTSPCGHTWCRVCILECLNHNNLCPLCRRHLPPSSFFKRRPVNRALTALIDVVRVGRTGGGGDPGITRESTPSLSLSSSFAMQISLASPASEGKGKRPWEGDGDLMEESQENTTAPDNGAMVELETNNDQFDATAASSSCGSYSSCVPFACLRTSNGKRTNIAEPLASCTTSSTAKVNLLSTLSRSATPTPTLTTVQTYGTLMKVRNCIPMEESDGGGGDGEGDCNQLGGADDPRPRYFVNAIGECRFRVLERRISEQGYCVGLVELVDDLEPEDLDDCEEEGVSEVDEVDVDLKVWWMACAEVDVRECVSFANVLPFDEGNVRSRHSGVGSGNGGGTERVLGSVERASGSGSVGTDDDEQRNQQECDQDSMELCCSDLEDGDGVVDGDVEEEMEDFTMSSYQDRPGSSASCESSRGGICPSPKTYASVNSFDSQFDCPLTAFFKLRARDIGAAASSVIETSTRLWTTVPNNSPAGVRAAQTKTATATPRNGEENSCLLSRIFNVAYTCGHDANTNVNEDLEGVAQASSSSSSSSTPWKPPAFGNEKDDTNSPKDVNPVNKFAHRSPFASRVVPSAPVSSSPRQTLPVSIEPADLYKAVVALRSRVIAHLESLSESERLHFELLNGIPPEPADMGMLTFWIANLMKVGEYRKYALLGMTNVVRRMRAVVEWEGEEGFGLGSFGGGKGRGGGCGMHEKKK